MENPDAGYHSYLLRLWRSADGERPVWRASLEHPLTGERWGFPSMEGLMDFLHRICQVDVKDGAREVE